MVSYSFLLEILVESSCLKSHLAAVVRRLRLAYRDDNEVEALSVVSDYAPFLDF